MRAAPAALLLAAAACTGGGREQPLPPLSTGDLEARIERLSSEGTLVVNLWATWCPPCMAELPAFATVARRHPELGFLGVSADWSLYFDEAELDPDRARVAARWRELEMPFPSVYLTETDLAAMAEALDLPDAVLPQTLLYRNGRRLARHSGELSEDGLEALLAPFLAR